MQFAIDVPSCVLALLLRVRSDPLPPRARLLLFVVAPGALDPVSSRGRVLPPLPRHLQWNAEFKWGWFNGYNTWCRGTYRGAYFGIGLLFSYLILFIQASAALRARPYPGRATRADATACHRCLLPRSSTSSRTPLRARGWPGKPLRRSRPGSRRRRSRVAPVLRCFRLWGLWRCAASSTSTSAARAASAAAAVHYQAG